MKKLIAKLIGGVTALAMAIDVGVAAMNNKVERALSKEEKSNQMIEYLSELIKKIPYGKGDKSK